MSYDHRIRKEEWVDEQFPQASLPQNLLHQWTRYWLIFNPPESYFHPSFQVTRVNFFIVQVHSSRIVDAQDGSRLDSFGNM